MPGLFGILPPRGNSSPAAAGSSPDRSRTNSTGSTSRRRNTGGPPLVYQTTVCPACWYAAYDADFQGLPEKCRDAIDGIERAASRISNRSSRADFSASRTLAEARRANYLALRCYDFSRKSSLRP
jgi:hypothetical protein